MQQAESHDNYNLSKRSHDRFQEYWNRLRGDRLMPRESDIDPDEIVEIWENCFLISNDEVTRRVGYRYSFLGKNLIEAFGEDITEHDAAVRLLSTSRVPNARKFDEVMSGRQPVMDEATFVNLSGMQISYRSCLLPLGLESGEVTHLIGCMRWKAK